jgi:acetoin utilization protein AcuC
MSRAAFICDEALWERGHPVDHPLRPERLRNTWQMLQSYHAFNVPTVRLVPPRPATDEQLATFHTPNYIEAVRFLSRGEHIVSPARFGFGPGDNPVFEGMFETEGLKVGAALVGAELLLNDEVDVAFSFAGGLHHAAPDFACGFCVFGDAAIAIKRMVAAGWRVAYIDIDAHHGDGVQAAFYDDPRVLTISLHESGVFLFPGTGFTDEIGQDAGCGYNVNVPFYPYTDNETYLWAFDQIVPPLVEQFAPDVIVSQLGVDAHWQDPLTHLALTTEGFEALFQRIRDLSPGRWLALGGGGYDGSVVPRAWTLAWGVISKQTFPNSLPQPIRHEYNPPFLRDSKPAPLSPNQRRQARQSAEQTVKKLREVGLLTQ